MDDDVFLKTAPSLVIFIFGSAELAIAALNTLKDGSHCNVIINEMSDTCIYHLQVCMSIAASHR